MIKNSLSFLFGQQCGGSDSETEFFEKTQFLQGAVTAFKTSDLME